MIARIMKIGGFSVVCLGLASAMLLMGNQVPKSKSSRVPLVQDWTSRHMVFSAPRSIIRNLQVQRDPRYSQQYLSKYVVPYRTSGPANPDQFGPPSHGSFGPPSYGSFGPPDRGPFGPPNRGPFRPPIHDPISVLRRAASDLNRDWAVPIVAGATMGDGNFPAKYTFNANETVDATACTNDYVVYTTDLTTTTALSIYAFNDLYVNAAATGVCPGTVPNVMWAYETNIAATGKPIGSPVLSLDGTQVAWMEGGSGVAYLHILRPVAGQGTIAAPVAPGSVTSIIGNTSTNGAAYVTCKTGAGSCELTIRYGNGLDNTISSPYYDYSNDVIFVGDASGYVHEFSGIFRGTPEEVCAASGCPGQDFGGGWPVSVASHSLGSPVYDETSENVFVGDTNGALREVRTSAGSPGTGCQVGTVPCRGQNDFPLQTGSLISNDGPIVDSTTQMVFAFGNEVGTGAVVMEADTGLTPGSQLFVPVGTSIANTIHDGAFDNGYYTTDTSLANATGNLYVCGNNGTEPELMRISVSAGLISTGTPTSEFQAATASTECSPVTEFYNPNANKGAGQDNLYFSVNASGPTATDCTGEGCVFAASLSGSGTSQTVNVGGALAVSGGTSGISVDNDSTAAGANNLYYTWLGNSSPTYPCAGNTTGLACAVSASQAGLGSFGAVVQTAAGDSASATFQTSYFGTAAKAGDLILLFSHWDNQAATATVSDNAGNTYTPIGTFTDLGATDVMEAWYTVNAGAPTSFTVTYSAMTTTISLLDVAEFSGLATAAPVDQTAVNTGTGTAMSTGATATTTDTNDTIVGLFATVGGNGYPFTPGANYSTVIIDKTTIVEDLPVISPGAYTATATASNSISWGARVVAFKNLVQ